MQNPQKLDRNYLTTNEVANLLMVSSVTIRDWVRNGWLHGDVTAGGHLRFRETQIRRFARDRQIAIQPSHGDGPHILIVDDDDQFARFLREVIQQNSPTANVTIATNGFDAGALIRDSEPQVVIVDLSMPGLSGYDVCRRLKSDPISQDVRVFGVTGLADTENYSDFLQAGAEVCFSKPIDTQALLDALDLPNHDVDTKQS